MDDQEYIAIPMSPREAERVERELRKVARGLENGYHDMPNGDEKIETGNTIHSLNGVISKFKHANYKLPWSVLEKIYYPDKK